MNRQSWSFQEDEAISKLVGHYGFNDWTQIALKLKEIYNISKRTGKQCRERWYNHLNPSVNKKPWCNEEEERLFELHKSYGNRWKDISRQFTGRTDNDIKNHFYSTLRRSLRRLNKILGQKNSTSQMREIKPSVLSTIMNYLYEQEHGIENDLYKSLRDLPSLIFEFANFKPIKTNLKFAKVEDAKNKISQIFELINRFNQQYEETKLIRHNSKQLKKSNSRKQTVESLTTINQNIDMEPTVKIEFQEENNYIIKAAQPSQHHSESFEADEMLMKSQDHPLLQDKQEEKEQERQQEDIDQVGSIKHYLSRNMSLEDDQMAFEQMKDPEQPSMISGTVQNIDLTVFGYHWQPQSWQRQRVNKEIVDEVLQIDYGNS